MKLMLIGYALSLMFALLMVVRVWRASTLDGVLTLLVPFYFLFAMVKYWNEPEHNIRFHALGFVLAGALGVYGAVNLVEEVVAGGTPEQRAALLQALREQGITPTPEQERAVLGDDPAAALATLQALQQDSETAAAPAESAPPPVAARPAEVLSYAEAARRAVVNRGRWMREAIGLTVDVPPRFRLITATDVRRLDHARGRNEDARSLGWIIHENLSLADPDAWHVVMRWHSEGWIATAALEPAALLEAALANRAPQARVAVSTGDLVGYAIAPQFDGQVLDWAEERVLANSDEQVVDCHALRLGRRGFLEFSITGMAPKSAALCHASVRLLAERSSFMPGREYAPAAPSEGLRAPYTVAALATHAP